MNDDMNNLPDENDLEDEEQEETQEEQPGQDSNGKPKAPSGISGIKGKAKTTITTTLEKGAKTVFTIVNAVIPTPVKIAFLLIIVFVILVILAQGDLTDKTAKHVTHEVNKLVNAADANLTDEQKEDYKERASLLKFPLTAINKIYDSFDKNNGYSSVIKKSFQYVLGTREVLESSTVATGPGSITTGNGTWDQGGLDNVKMEVPGEEKTFNVSFYTNLPTDENSSTRLTPNGEALKFGMVASNNFEIGTKILLEGHGVYTVQDTSIDGLNSEEDIAIFIPQKSGESSEDYKKRVEGYNKETIKGKIISVDDYSEYIYSNFSSAGTDMHNGINVYNADGSVNDDKILELQKSIEAQYNLVSAPEQLLVASGTRVTRDDKLRVKDSNAAQIGEDYFKAVDGLISTLKSEVYQCVWWARGRAATYLAKYGTTRKKWPDGLANGGQFIKNYEKYFNWGTTPKENSLAVFPGGTKGGHVAYVEAVDNVNKYFYISHAGVGVSWYGINKIPFGGSPFSDHELEGFLYLDEPKS